MFVLLMRVCVVYVVKKVRHSRVHGQLMGVAHYDECKYCIVLSKYMYFTHKVHYSQWKYSDSM